MEEIKDYWNLRANGSLAVEEELKTEVGVRWKKIFQEYIKKEHANVLDDGTGAGFFPVILSSLGHCVTAIDYSDEMVEQAKKRFADHGLTVKVQQMDAQHLQMRASMQLFQEMCSGISTIQPRPTARCTGC